MKKTFIILPIVAIVVVAAVIIARKQAFQQGYADAVPDATGQSKYRGNSILGFITDDAYRNGRASYESQRTNAQ